MRMNGMRTAFALALTTAMALLTPTLIAQSKAPEAGKYQFKIGVLPFVNNSGSGGADVGSAVGRAVQAELTHSTRLIGRVLKLDDGMTADDVDGEKATEIGRKNNMDVVLVGLVLEASSQQSQKNVRSPSIFGQRVGGNTRSVKSTVTLQADLYNLTDGQKIDSIRVTASATDRKLGTDIDTDLGSINTGGSSFDSTPIGKALQQAVADMVKKIAGNERKMVRYQPATEADAPK